MSSNFVNASRNQLYLMPPCVQDWLPENHLARFVVDIVSQLDLKPLYAAYSGRGSKAHHPEILLALLFYGYATGVFSSRKLERSTYDSIAFRFIAANTHPDHDTIATFRKRFLNELKPLFVQILQVARQMGMLKIGKVSLDGTKIKANASKHRALSWKYACKLEKQLKSEVEELLRLAEKADNSKVPDELSIPDEISRRKERLNLIDEAKKEIEKRAEERYAKEKEEYEKKMAEREAKEKKTGKKTGGKEPKPPEEGPKKKDQVNLTDEESRIMPSANGFEQAYNAQASTDIDTHLIVENHVTQCSNDKKEVIPTLEGLDNLPEELGKTEALLADTGYFSATNVKSCEKESITPYIATGRDKHNQPFQERHAEPPAISEDADSVEKMKHRLKTKEGKKIYAKRKSTIETIFGILKHVIGFRQFSLRGFASVSGEWDLVCCAYNIKRLHVMAK